MGFELDHLFICASRGGPEAEPLVQFGLTEGAPNHHPGQGTACRRFFFRNAYLELLWMVNPTELQSDPVRRTGLWERLTGGARGASPFGIALRPSHVSSAPAPFPVWEYRPSYLPAQYAIRIATESEDGNQPLLFLMPFARRPDSAAAVSPQPREHAAGLRTITRVQLLTPHARLALDSLGILEHECPWLSFVAANEHRMEVEFDGQSAGQSTDFRPCLPLILRW